MNALVNKGKKRQVIAILLVLILGGLVVFILSSSRSQAVCTRQLAPASESIRFNNLLEQQLSTDALDIELALANLELSVGAAAIESRVCPDLLDSELLEMITSGGVRYRFFYQKSDDFQYQIGLEYMQEKYYAD